MAYLAAVLAGCLFGGLGVLRLNATGPRERLGTLSSSINVASAGVVAAGALAVLNSLDWNFSPSAVDYAAALVGITELVARYRDAPLAALLTLPASFYIAVNAGASAAALALVRVFGWTFGQPSGSAGERWVRILIAGVGAVALFRSSLFLVRVGETDVGVGPSSLLQVLLTAADRAVDRKRGYSRAKAIGSLMRGVSFAKAKSALPTYCLALMQNMSSDDQENLGRDVKELAADQSMTDDVKALNLGLRLMNVVGPDVLHAAIASLGQLIRDPVSPVPGTAPGDGAGQVDGAGQADDAPPANDPVPVVGDANAAAAPDNLAPMPPSPGSES